MKNFGNNILLVLDKLMTKKSYVAPSRQQELNDLTKFVRNWSNMDQEGFNLFSKTLITSNEDVIDGLINLSKNMKLKCRIYI